MNFSAGQLSKTVILTPAFDQTTEGEETFTVALRVPGSPGHDYTIGDPSEALIVIFELQQLIFEDSFETP